jgi:hypothetical protein
LTSIITKPQKHQGKQKKIQQKTQWTPGTTTMLRDNKIYTGNKSRADPTTF